LRSARPGCRSTRLRRPSLGEAECRATPFALAALATIALLYAFVLRVTQCRRAASRPRVPRRIDAVPARARDARSYAFNMLFTVLPVSPKARRLARNAGLRGGAFHTQIIPAAIALGRPVPRAFHPASARC
jgi:hypothetical protein